MLCDVDHPTFCRQSVYRRQSDYQLHTPAAFYTQGIFVVLICVRGWVNYRVRAPVYLRAIVWDSKPRPSCLQHSASNYRVRVPINFRAIVWDSSPWPSGLHYSASTNFATACPSYIIIFCSKSAIYYAIKCMFYLKDYFETLKFVH
jgi:hypothetical protein